MPCCLRLVSLAGVLVGLTASAACLSAEPSIDPFAELNWMSPRRAEATAAGSAAGSTTLRRFALPPATSAPATIAQVDPHVVRAAATAPIGKPPQAILVAPRTDVVAPLGSADHPLPPAAAAPASAPFPTSGASADGGANAPATLGETGDSTPLPPPHTYQVAPDEVPSDAALDGYSSDLVDSVAPPPEETAHARSTRIEPLRFNGVQPSVSTIDDVRRAWGETSRVVARGGVAHYGYMLAPFKSIEVTFYKGKVLSIDISLNQEFPPAILAEHLALDDAPALVLGDSGEFEGQIYPARGVSFEFMSGRTERRVSKITLEGIDADNFVVRALGCLPADYTGCMEDLESALSIDPNCTRAHWQKARLLSKVGRHQDALAACAEALKLDPENPEYRLTRAQVLAANGRIEEALAEARAASEQAASRPELHARCLLVMGDCISNGAARDYQAALDLHLEAVKRAEALVTHKSLAVRRMAKETLIEAHLAAAQDIAWGNWQKKDEVVAKWLDRARWLCERAARTDGVDPDCTIKAQRAALAVCVGLQGGTDASFWANELTRLTRRALEATRDPLRQQELHWMAASGLYDAVQTCYLRGEHAMALEHATDAVAHLDHCLDQRQLTPGEQLLIGRLYYRVGLIHATQHANHDQAAEWFDRALPFVTRTQLVSAVSDPGRQGETLVSIAVSMWRVGRRDEAITLTRDGLGLMEQAVRDGYLVEHALAVPYANLSSMHAELGDSDEASDYHKLAERFEQSRQVR